MRDRIWANVVYHLFWGNCIMIWRERHSEMGHIFGDKCLVVYKIDSINVAVG